MTNFKSKRPRIQSPKKFRAGDVFWHPIGPTEHLTIILADHTIDNHQECIPVCNFSGTPTSTLEYVIPIGNYKLPDHWWLYNNQPKPENWIVCQPKDCIKAADYSARNYVIGNIKDECPRLFDKLCNATRNCKISARLNGLCDCENDSRPLVEDDSMCECENIPE